MDTEEALRRVKLIAPMLRGDVERAILSHAVMEAANDTKSQRAWPAPTPTSVTPIFLPCRTRLR